MINKLKTEKYLILTCIYVFCACLYYYLSGSIENGGPDSVARTQGVMRIFHVGYNWSNNDIWLPFYYVLYGLPLLFKYHSSSILFFQFLLALLTFIPLYFIFKKEFNKTNALISIILCASLPTHLNLIASANSETSFNFFFILGLCLYLYKGDQFKYFILIVLCFLAAAFIRYEGWIFYFLFLAYDTYKYKKISRFLIILTPFSFILYKHQTYRIESGLRLFHGLVANPDDVEWGLSLANKSSLFVRVKNLFMIWFSNINFLTLLIPVAIYRFYKERKFTILFSLYLIYSGILITAVMIQALMPFHKYFIITIIFGIPFIVNHIQKSPYFKIQTLKYSLLILIILLMKPYQGPYNIHGTTVPGYKEMTKYIMELNPKSIYFTDRYRGYLYFALIFHIKEDAPQMSLYNPDESLYVKFSHEDYQEVLYKEVQDSITKNKIEYILFFQGSEIYQRLLNNVTSENKYQLQQVHRNQSILLYKIIH